MALLVGELKKRRTNSSDAYTDSDMDQLFIRCFEVLERQPTRSIIYGYLSDLQSIVFVRVDRGREVPLYTYEKTAVALLAAACPTGVSGGELLMSLLSASYASLGWSLPEICVPVSTPLCVGTYLGTGARFSFELTF